MTTPILEITELADGQINQFATMNTALRALEAAANDSLSVDLTSADATLTSAQFFGYWLFRTTGNAVSRTLNVPQKKRVFAVYNGGSATLNVTRGTTTLTVAASKTRIYYADGTANGLMLLDLT